MDKVNITKFVWNGRVYNPSSPLKIKKPKLKAQLKEDTFCTQLTGLR